MRYLRWLLVTSLAGLSLSLFMVASPCKAQDKMAVMRKALEAEVEARKKIRRAGAVQSNAADRLLNNNRVATTRTGSQTNPAGAHAISVVVDVAAVGAPAVNPPAPKVVPPNLVANFYGDWPNTGFCAFTLSPREGIQGAPGGCNDTLSHLVVPLGLKVRLCEHDGGGGDWGQCPEFGAGDHGVGPEFSDKATSFWVTDTNEN